MQNITEATLNRLQDISKGDLTRQAVQQLSIPCSDELHEVQYVLARLQPGLQKLSFSCVSDALYAMQEHYAYHSKVAAKVNQRSDAVIEALLLIDSAKSFAIVNPFTYACDND